jgi:hypothetical protein
MNRTFRTCFAVACALATAPAANAAVYTACDIATVGAFGNRVHIRCDQPYPTTTIQYFAVPATKRDMANHVEAIALTAQVTGATVYVYFDPADTSGASIGCQASDCRLATAVEIHGVGPLASTPAARTIPPVAALTLPEPSEGSALLASSLALGALATRRQGSLRRSARHGIMPAR